MLEIDGANKREFLFVPTADKDNSVVFLRQISELDPDALHLVIWDKTGFHPRDGEASVPANVRLPGLPPYSPELNPVEGLSERIKDAVSNQLWPPSTRWRTPSLMKSPPSAKAVRLSPA
ncbi:MAG: transposase [Opitutaceae bacterium]|nr:transposase [Opitutaceae bacterium]